MIEPEYIKSLEFQLRQKTGGLRSPQTVKQFIDILEQWLPPAEKPTNPYDKEYYAGYNAYKNQILENLRWVK
jgi:hypothetical protein